MEHATDAEGSARPEAADPSHALRILVAGGLIVLGAAMLIWSSPVRGAEARLTATVTSVLLGADTEVDAAHASFWFGRDGTWEWGLRITGACSSALVIGPMIITLGLLALLKRLPVGQIVLATAVGASIILVVNVGRVVLIAASQLRWGTEVSFWWSHVVAGSVIAVVGDVAGVAAATRLTFGGRRGRRAVPLS